MKLSIIIPAFNEENRIGDVLDKVRKLKIDNLEKEVIVVDDGSTDGTKEVVKEHGVTVVSHKTNMGKGSAIRTGIKNSSGDIILIQDADGEYCPEEIPKMINRILEGAQVVYGSRFTGDVKGMCLSHWIGNRVLTLVTKVLFRSNITDMETGYKVFRRKVLNDLNLQSRGFEIEPEITAKVLARGYKITEIPIKYNARAKGEKTISWKDGIKHLMLLVRLRLGM